MNGGEILVAGLVLVLGCAAFFVGIVYLLCSFLAVLGRGILSMVFPHWRQSPRRRAGGGIKACPNPKCRELETRPARYCGHCGTEMKS
jgi:hypothetical protein